MNTLYLDTSCDRWMFKKGADSEQPSFLVRLAWLLESEDGQTIRDACHLIRLPQGVRMANEAAHSLGIYEHHLLERGKTLGEVLKEFAEALGEAQTAVAHGMSFHRRALNSSFAYLGMPARTWPETVCVMGSSVSIVKAPAVGRDGYKTPSFDDCCEKFCGGQIRITMDPVTDGLARVRAVRKFWSEVRRHQQMEVAS